MYQRYTSEIEQFIEEGNYRKLPAAISENIINLSSNDYLGLNSDVALKNEFLNYISGRNIKLSAASARLLTGNSDAYTKLENTIKNAYNREACLVYNSGYHANIGILPCLASKRDLIISDKLVHASIIDGIHLSSATHERYSHLNYNHLEAILQKQRQNFEHVFVVTESIFSMDGDMANLEKLVELKQKYNCFLYVDEAHALGVRGKTGLGCAEEFDCINQCDFIIGTFGKAIASVGAYVICNEIINQYLVNRSRSFIFTTALPPINLEWTNFIFERIASYHDKRQQVKDISQQFAKLLEQPYISHIMPYITGSNKSAIEASAQLINQGYYVLPIRYPTVPQNKARLRFSLNAGLQINDLRKVPEILKCYATALD